MRKLFALAALVLSLYGYAQKTPEYKLGNVSAQDLSRPIYSLDSNASAVVLMDIGSSEITGNNKGTFSLKFKAFRRVHILNKNGYDAGNVAIYLFKEGQREETIQGLKAYTHNLENGKVVTTKLDVKSGVFKDVLNENVTVRKFTFPNLKEGSIIEYEYTIESDFYRNLRGWSFQEEYPVLWSEYKVSVPQFLTYLTLSQGYLPFTVHEQTSTQGKFDMADGQGIGRTERISFNTGINHVRWAIQDVPALKEEAYTSTLENHVAKIQFQLSSIGYPFEPMNYMDSWPTVTRHLLEREDFGASLSRDNPFLNDVLESQISEGDAPLEKARKIYNWVRDNFTCTDHGYLYMSSNLRNVYKDRNGTEADINLLLTAMLRKAGLKVDPLILSTRSHGFVHPVYPIMQRFNYVISRLEIEGKTYYLDASHPMLGFGKLNYECYNGFAFIINPEATPTKLESQQIKEESYASVFMVNGDDGKTIGSFTYSPGYVESLDIRKDIKEKGMEAFTESIRKKHGSDFTVDKLRVDSLKHLDENVVVSYNLDYTADKEDILYINPMFGEGYKENPFKSAKRFYPVEIPFAIDETYNLQMEVPAGYELDELPKQAVVKFNHMGDAEFEYRISHSGNMISLRSRIQIKKTLFHPDDYEVLREFFSLIVTKHNEQIVFKKKKAQ